MPPPSKLPSKVTTIVPDAASDGEILHLAAVWLALQTWLPVLTVVGPLGVVGMAVATRAKDRTAMMDWNCILAGVERLDGRVD